MRRPWAYAAPLLLFAACAGPGLFTDGSSVSLGAFNDGCLRRGSRLAPKGDGYLVPALWAGRETNWATDELVRAISRAARRVRREYPGGQLGVGDLSARGGGASTLHRSHHNGRDADLIFYAVDQAGRPLPPADSMPRYFGPQLAAHDPGPPSSGVVYGPFSPRYFDVVRNWALVRALLEQPGIEIQYLFIQAELRRVLLEWAASQGEEPSLLERARELLRQPGDSAPHDDHLHVRIYCAADDRAQGCVDRGPERWWKKRWKYMPPSAQDTAEALADGLRRLFQPRAWRLPGFVP